MKKLKVFIPNRVAVFGLGSLLWACMAGINAAVGNPFHSLICLLLGVIWNLLTVWIFYCNHCKRRAPIDNWFYYPIFGALMVKECPTCHEDPFEQVERVEEFKIASGRARFTTDAIDTTIVSLLLGSYFSFVSEVRLNVAINLALVFVGTNLINLITITLFGGTIGNFLTKTKIVNAKGKKISLLEWLKWGSVDLGSNIVALFIGILAIYDLSDSAFASVSRVQEVWVTISQSSKLYSYSNYLGIIWMLGNGIYFLWNSKRQTFADKLASVWTVRK